MSSVAVSSPRSKGIKSLRVAANGRLPDAYNLADLNGYLNMIASKRLHVLAQGGGTVGNYTPGSIVTGGQFRTSPNVGKVMAVVIAARSTSASVFGSVFFTVDGVANDTSYIGGSTGGTLAPGDFCIVTTQLRVAAGGAGLSGDTAYTWTLETAAGVSALHYFIIFEVPKNTVIESTAMTALAPDVFSVGAPILDRDVRGLLDNEYKIYRRSCVSHFSHSRWSAANPSQTGATFKNILDGSTAGYSSSAAGFWSIPYRKNRMQGTTLNVVLWCFSNVSAGTDGQVRFSNSAGTIGTISSIGTSATIRTASATIDASTSGSQLVIVEHASAGSTVFTTSAGMYEFLT